MSMKPRSWRLQKVLWWLEDQPTIHVLDVCDQCDLPPYLARDSLRAWVASGYLRKVGLNTYALPEAN